MYEPASRRASTLTPTELKVCTLLKSNLSTKEIAEVLNSSIHTVETHRRRIRKKLGLSGQANLTTFLALLASSAPEPGAPDGFGDSTGSA